MAPKKKWTGYNDDQPLAPTAMFLYELCGLRFLWERGWEGVDLGAGPGEPKPPPEKDSRHHAVMGIAIQAVYEDFYNKQIWKHYKGKALREHLDELAKHHFERVLRKPWNWVDHRQMSKSEMMRVVREGVRGYLKTMAYHKFLGPVARAEVDMRIYLEPNKIPLSGRPDVIIERPDTGVTILDGKNAQSRDKYTDPDQLRWYAMLYYVIHGRLPDRLAFVYYRYPYNAETGETGVTWINVTQEDIQGLAARARATKAGMKAREFEAKPSSKACRFCPYEKVCDVRQSTKRKRKKKVDPLEKEWGIDQGGIIEL